VYGAAWLGGIGFTMSIFIGGLAFDDVAMLDMTKRAIFAASLLSGVAGWIILRFARVGRSDRDGLWQGAARGNGAAR
jgi:NhaA family Na+:H+ antiporter